MNPIIELSWIDLTAASSFVILVAVLTRLKGVGGQMEFLVSALRMVVQLLVVGYVLVFLFEQESAALVMVVLVIMGGFAVQTVLGRVQHTFPGLWKIVSISIFLGCGVITFIFCNLIIRVDPWYDPRYLIPLTGMIIGNSMNGLALGAERLSAEFRQRIDEIETALSLGASRSLAARPAVASAYRASIIPTISSMSAIGLVFLPGMMTGQILSGTSPLLAVRYQVAIMFAISGSVALASFFMIHLGYRKFFTDQHQLRVDLLQ